MTLPEVIDALVSGIKNTGFLEFTAVFAGIASVWLSNRENIWVYPVGLVNTILYIYISLKGHLLGEASVNIFYTVMSVYGWILWARHDERKQKLLTITYSSAREWALHLLFFGGLYVIIYTLLIYLKKAFAPGAIPAADAFASATAYTGMLLMAQKKVESWYWWILTNIASIPLYFVKGYVFTSFQFLVLLVMAFAGLYSWRQKALHAT